MIEYFTEHNFLHRWSLQLPRLYLVTSSGLSCMKVRRLYREFEDIINCGASQGIRSTRATLWWRLCINLSLFSFTVSLYEYVRSLALSQIESLFRFRSLRSCGRVSSPDALFGLRTTHPSSGRPWMSQLRLLRTGSYCRGLPRTPAIEVGLRPRCW